MAPLHANSRARGSLRTRSSRSERPEVHPQELLFSDSSETFTAQTDRYKFSHTPLQCQGIKKESNKRCERRIDYRRIPKFPVLERGGVVAYYIDEDNRNCLVAFYCEDHYRQLPVFPLRVPRSKREEVARRTRTYARRPLREKTRNLPIRSEEPTTMFTFGVSESAEEATDVPIKSERPAKSLKFRVLDEERPSNNLILPEGNGKVFTFGAVDGKEATNVPSKSEKPASMFDFGSSDGNQFPSVSTQSGGPAIVFNFGAADAKEATDELRSTTRAPDSQTSHTAQALGTQNTFTLFQTGTRPTTTKKLSVYRDADANEKEAVTGSTASKEQDGPPMPNMAKRRDTELTGLKDSLKKQNAKIAELEQTNVHWLAVAQTLADQLENLQAKMKSLEEERIAVRDTAKADQQYTTVDLNAEDSASAPKKPAPYEYYQPREVMQARVSKEPLISAELMDLEPGAAPRKSMGVWDRIRATFCLCTWSRIDEEEH